ncbi:hypothetical protein Xvie_03815 [Xenorhabdus vietnamensis]|uniref:Uncharacterized protein n=1 Tax=Xenorhabdus vietnamensis TaxID=351656 RepID=A0A1Y2S832_9GAMM|nr:hypothetical protein [Xenorhabdus vietnamensis]OTA14296.1 hypothetical protein Xvie_03815 [Xenorhabdus vietnamensis]
MAKKTQQELGELPPELQVGSTDDTTPQDTQPAPSDELDSDELSADEETPEFVVVKGHTVRHNGVDYPENTVIDLQGDDVERLIQLGVVMRLDTLKSQLLSGNSVTVQDGVKIQQEA